MERRNADISSIWLNSDFSGLNHTAGLSQLQNHGIPTFKMHKQPIVIMGSQVGNGLEDIYCSKPPIALCISNWITSGLMEKFIFLVQSQSWIHVWSCQHHSSFADALKKILCPSPAGAQLSKLHDHTWRPINSSYGNS